MNVSGITSFNKNFDQVFMNNSFGAENFEPKPIFEKTLNEIKYNRLKGITSIDMNISAIISFNRKIDPLSINKSFEAETL